MQETNREGVLMEVCPQCGGVWLDRGELETFMERLHVPGDVSLGDERRAPYKRKSSDLTDFFG